METNHSPHETYLETLESTEELKSTISTLEAHLKELEKSGDFLEADKTHNRIKQLKKTLKDTEEEALRNKQTTDRAEIENLHSRDFEVFNESWDNRFEEYKQACIRAEEELKEKHQKELDVEKDRLEKTVPIIPKHSSEYLNLKRIMDNLVRQKNYKEAHTIQQQLLALDQSEKSRWEDTRNQKIEKELIALIKKQELELDSSKVKQKKGLNELKKKRAAEMEALIKHYQNMKNEMGTVQNIERSRISGKIKTQSLGNSSALSRLLTSSSKISFADKLLQGGMESSRPTTARRREQREQTNPSPPLEL